MILVNRNFGNPVLAQAIGDMFKPTSDEGQNIEWVNHTNALATDSTLVASLKNSYSFENVTASDMVTIGTEMLNLINNNPKNFFIVTDHFIRVLDKVYTKIWNESFTETGIYNVSNLATIYNGFVSDYSLKENSTFINNNSPAIINFMLFKKFVDRCITAGVLDEADRLQYEDQISLSNLNKVDLSTQIDLDNKLITFTAAKPIDIAPDLNGLDGEYLKDKKLFLMMVPYLTNENVIKKEPILNSPGNYYTPIMEPFGNEIGSTSTITNLGNPGYATDNDYVAPVRRPIAFFKPKTDASKFGRSLPLATHLIWSIGTPDDKELALLEGKPVPDLIFDHLDRISHIDSLTLKIKFDKLQF